MKKNQDLSWDAKFSGLKKVFRIMKLTAFLILISMFGVFANKTYSQSKMLNLNMEKATVREVLSKIEDQSEFNFMYSGEFIDVNRLVSINVQDAKIDEVLKSLFAGTDVGYTIKDRLVVLNLTDVSTVQQQSLSVSGRVTDSSGSPLPGVTVVVKGTTNGTITNVDGKYNIGNVPGNATLVFSFVGMKTQEISVNEKKIVNVKMEDETIGLDEVVAIGYGTQKKVNLTGSVGTIDSKALENRSQRNASQMLEGIIPGLNISQSSGGSLESNPSINVRGIATIGEGSTGTPLILIDGMEGDINALNPNDIESISVLKDAAASSIYGSRAPFGVILVTTKKGKEGQMTIDYNNNFNLNFPMAVPKMMNSFQFATYFNDASLNSGATPYFTDERIQQIKDFMAGKVTYSTVPNATNPKVWGDYKYAFDNVDWYKVIFRDKAFSQEHNISFSGGNKSTQYYASGNYLGQDGLMKINQDFFKRYAYTIKLSTQLTDWASVNVSTRFVREDYQRPTQLDNNLFYALARQGWPILPVYDPNGYMFDSPSPALGLRDGGQYKDQTDWLYQQLQVVLEPVRGWKIFGEMNYRTQNIFTHTDVQQTYNHDVNGIPYLYDKTSSVSETGSRQNFYNTNIYTEYQRKIKNAHNLKIMAGFQSELNKSRYLSSKREGIIVPELPVLDLTSGTDYVGKVVPPSVGGNYNEWATAGYFGRINYDYLGKYLFEINLRYDGTSRFRGDKRWNLFPSFSSGWNIARENFWKNYQNTINNFKIRVSYGKLGNQNTSSWYPTYVIMPVGTANGTWLLNNAKPNTSNAPGIVSQSLTWEKILNWNVGTDISSFNNRLTASFDYFVRLTENMVGPAPELPVTLGTNVPKINNTDLKTYGFELQVTWNDHLKNGLGYDVRFLLSDSQTEITKYPNPTGLLNSYRKGQKIGEIWGFETIGIAKTQDEMDAHLAELPNGGQNALGTQWEAGDIMYRDINDDGKITKGSSTETDPGDLKIIGNNQPHYQFGLNLGVNWKGFDARVFFQGIMKRDFFQSSYYFWGYSSSDGMWRSTGFTEHLDYFRTDKDHPLGQNLDSYYPRPLAKGSKNQQTQTRYLLNASYIRLKNLQIGYTLPRQLLKGLVISKMRIFISGENLWTGTKMTKIFDPETIGGGYGGSVYPLSKVVSVGLDVNF